MGGKITKLYPPPTKMKPKPNLSSVRIYQSVHPATILDLWSKNGLQLKMWAFGLFNLIQLDCHWQSKSAVLSVQLQSSWIPLNRQKTCIFS